MICQGAKSTQQTFIGQPNQRKRKVLQGRYSISHDDHLDDDAKPSRFCFSMSSPIRPLHHSLHIVAPNPIPLPRRRQDRLAQGLYPPHTWVSGGDIRSSAQYGLGPGLTFAAFAPRSGGRWKKIVTFRFHGGDREVGDSTHYGRCSGFKKSTYQWLLRIQGGLLRGSEGVYIPSNEARETWQSRKYLGLILDAEWVPNPLYVELIFQLP